MINIVWSVLIALSIVAAAATGKTMVIPETIAHASTRAVEFCIGLAGMLAFWSGMIKVAAAAGVTGRIAKLFSPWLRLVFPTLSRQNEVLGTISLALSANLLGLGNIATPLGLKAMQELQALNQEKERISPEIGAFLALVLGGLSVFPSTLIAIRSQAGSTNPSLVILPVFLVTLCGTMVGLGINFLAYRLSSLRWPKGR